MQTTFIARQDQAHIEELEFLLNSSANVRYRETTKKEPEEYTKHYDKWWQLVDVNPSWSYNDAMESGIALAENEIEKEIEKAQIIKEIEQGIIKNFDVVDRVLWAMNKEEKYKEV